MMPPLPRLKHIESQDPKYFALRRRTVNAFYGFTALSLIAVIVIGAWGIVLAIISIGWLIVATQLNLYHRTQIENFHHYRQIEALFSLHNLLEFRYPLPPMRLWVMSPDFAVLLAATIQQQRPKLIVELGSGVSTLISAYSLEKNGEGRVISFEHDASFADQTIDSLKKHHLESWAEVIHAPLSIAEVSGKNTRWYNSSPMQNIGPIDLLVVDGPPEDTQLSARYPALPKLYDQLAEGALIFVDDYLRRDEHAMVNRWLQMFDLEVVETLANEKGAAILLKTGARPTNSPQTTAE